MNPINDNTELQQEAYQLALYALHDGDAEVPQHSNMMHEVLTEKIIELLSKNPERLMSILYRIDVDEQQINDVMKNAPVGGIASRLAILVMERMKQKAETRRKYKDNSKEE